MQGYVVVFAAIVTVMGTVWVARTSRKASEKATNLATNLEIHKTQATANADIVKTTTEAETKRIDQVIDSQQEFIRIIQDENKQQRVEMLEKDKLHREEMLQIRSDVAELTRLMTICVEERSKFKSEMEKQTALYDAVVAQMKSSAKARAAAKKISKVEGTIKGEIHED